MTTERDQRLEGILHRYLQAVDARDAPTRDELLRRHPELTDELTAFFADQDRLRDLAAVGDTPTLAPGEAAPATVAPERSFGDYELLDEIARGGMGVVYRARQRSLDRIVALKMILSGQLASETDIHRFHTEARTAAALQHPNIVAVHEVGEHGGQHFFSMDFVDGQSLAALVREHPLPPAEAVRYALGIAEAVAFAHERGVLHRDLKPANVLVERDGRVRVTDFGLARSLTADNGLTATGAVVGTPSYMPPEQAAADRGKVGPASDVYSLGATLYELVTGRPPFRAATPLDTLLQVLDAEPAPPRLLNPAVGRDLETVLLKCLEKDPARRYATAGELTEELRALVEGRPVKARPPGAVERLTRWYRQREKNVRTAVAAAVGAVLLVAALVGIGLGYDYWRRGTIVLGTPDEAFFDAEVLAADGTTVLPPFTVPTRQPLSLPAGDYKVRFTRRGRPSESGWLEVRRGSERKHGVSMESRLAYPPLWVQQSAALATGTEGLVLYAVSDGQLHRFEAATGREAWARPLVAENQEKLKNVRGWNPNFLNRLWPDPITHDLDGDGHTDAILAGREYGWIVAVSGRTGDVLWACLPAPTVPPGGQDDTLSADSDGLLTAPLAADANGDGTPDVLVACGRSLWNAQRWLEAVSGKTGTRLWRFDLDNQPPTNPRVAAPDVFTALGGVADRPFVGVVWGSRFTAVDAATGKPLYAPVTLPQPAVLPAKFANLGGPLGLALLWCGRGEDEDIVQLAAFDAGTGRPLWPSRAVPRAKTIPMPSGQFGHGFTLRMPRLPDWPLATDLDGDGVCELVTPYRHPAPASGYGLEVIDSRTGKTRWARPVWPGHESFQALLPGPPRVDGDRDLFSAAAVIDPGDSWNNRPQLVVTAHAGDDGRPRWQQRLPLPYSFRSNSHGCWFDPPCWSAASPTGAPLLVIPVVTDEVGQVILLDSAAGRFVRTLDNLLYPRAADVDGDGMDDLLTWATSNRAGARLSVVRANSPEPWQRLGKLSPTHDLNGDGMHDVLDDDSAYSGIDGQRLWRSSLETRLDRNRLEEPASPADRDLDGDGIADLLELLSAGSTTSRTSPLRAHSGRTGRQLWETPAIRVRSSAGERSGTTHFLTTRRHTAGPPRILLGHALEASGPVTTDWLTVLGGRDGALVWQHELDQGKTPFDRRTPSVAFTRAPGEAWDVLLLLSPWARGAGEVRLLAGDTGALRWSFPLREGEKARLTPLPSTDVLLAAARPSQFTLTRLDGATGQPAWSWSKAQLEELFQNQQEIVLGRSVVVPVRNAARQWLSELIVLDLETGREKTRYVPGGVVNSMLAPPTDGLAVLLFNVNNRIEAIDDAGRLVWRIDRPGYLLPRHVGSGTALVHHDTTATYLALEAATGKPRWRCHGPGELLGVVPVEGQPPRLLYQLEGVTVCRSALPVGPEGRYVLPPRAELPDIPDPWQVRPLPWVGPPWLLEWLAYPLFVAVVLYLFAISERRTAYRVLGALVVFTVLTAGVWLGIDSASMAPGQHYAPSQWHRPLALTAYVLAGTMILGHLALLLLRQLGRLFVYSCRQSGRLIGFLIRRRSAKR